MWVFRIGACEWVIALSLVQCAIKDEVAKRNERKKGGSLAALSPGIGLSVKKTNIDIKFL